MPLRLDSFKNSEVLPKPVVASETSEGNPSNHPTFARVSADADSQSGVSASAAPLDDRSPAELDARAFRLSQTLERIIGRSK